MARGLWMHQGGDAEVDFANIHYAVFESSGIFDVPDDVKLADVFLVQGGQGGNYMGGAGGQAKTVLNVKVVPGSKLTITVGAGSKGLNTTPNASNGWYTPTVSGADSGGHSTVTGTGVSLTSNGGIRGAASDEMSSITPFNEFTSLRQPFCHGGCRGYNNGYSKLHALGVSWGGGSRGNYGQPGWEDSYNNYNFPIDQENNKAIQGYGVGGGGIYNETTHWNGNMGDVTRYYGGYNGRAGIVIIRYYKEAA